MRGSGPCYGERRQALQRPVPRRKLGVMLNPDWPLALRLVIVAAPIVAAIWFFSTGSVALGAGFTVLTAYAFNALFMAYPGGKN